MDDQLIRAVVAASVVVVLPDSTSLGQRALPTRVVLSAVLMAAALAPELGSWRTWEVVLAVVVLGLPQPRTGHRFWREGARAALAAAVAAGITDEAASRHAIAHISDSRQIVIVLAGFVVATVVSGEMIGTVLHPFAEKLERSRSPDSGSTVPGIESAGRVIGWLERTLLFGLIVAGAPDAAAIVIAAKSVARFPSFAEERFAEYYLIGTLLSFLAALAVGVAVRSALGLHPLLSAGS
jgi:hypothetical protein